MTEEREGQIALAIVTYWISKGGVRISTGNFRWQIMRAAKAMNISEQEAAEFATRAAIRWIEADFSREIRQKE